MPRFAPSQWETALQCKDVSHWLGANLESTLCIPNSSPGVSLHKRRAPWSSSTDNGLLSSRARNPLRPTNGGTGWACICPWIGLSRYVPNVHYSDVIMSSMTSKITGVPTVYSTVCSGADQSKYQSPASLAFVRWIHWWPVISLQKGPVTRKMFLFDEVIMPHRETGRLCKEPDKMWELSWSERCMLRWWSEEGSQGCF